MLKKARCLFFTIFLFVLMVPLAVSAALVKAEEQVSVTKDQVIKGTVYAFANGINVEGTINGDLICLTRDLKISGKIEGDVICAGQNVQISGEVMGSLRLGGENIEISSKVNKNAQIAGSYINMGEQSEVGWEMFVAARQTILNGNISKNIYGVGEKITIGGVIGGDAFVNVGRSGAKNYPGLIVSDDAKINGNLKYTSNQAADISENAEVKGSIDHNLPDIKTSKKDMLYARLWHLIIKIFSSLIIGLILVSLWKKRVFELTELMYEKAGLSIIWGIILMVVAPLISIIVALTIIGIPLAMILFGFWLFAMYLSHILVGILFGQKLGNQIGLQKNNAVIFPMVIGIIVSQLIFFIPLIGWFLSLAAIWWGLGGIWLYFKKV